VAQEAARLDLANAKSRKLCFFFHELTAGSLPPSFLFRDFIDDACTFAYISRRVCKLNTLEELLKSRHARGRRFTKFFPNIPICFLNAMGFLSAPILSRGECVHRVEGSPGFRLSLPHIVNAASDVKNKWTDVYE
jgi:endonuclease/exonuclease/phosphatase (EEP) superfamily protein YafD